MFGELRIFGIGVGVRRWGMFLGGRLGDDGMAWWGISGDFGGFWGKG